MSESKQGSNTTRTRREPPRFRRVSVRRTEHLSPRLVRITFAGPDLDGLTVDEPAASVRLLLPSLGNRTLVMPSWNGNEFLLPDGRRPAIRTFTPRHIDARNLELKIDIVVHGAGVASEWAQTAEPGASAAISGPGRGYGIDREVMSFILAGDETAIPAISQLLEALPVQSRVQVHIEIAHLDAQISLPDHPSTSVQWHHRTPGAAPASALFEALRDAELGPNDRLWVAGEAAAIQRIRRLLFEDRGLPRTQVSARGYWKDGRTGSDGDT